MLHRRSQEAVADGSTSSALRQPEDGRDVQALGVAVVQLVGHALDDELQQLGRGGGDHLHDLMRKRKRILYYDYTAAINLNHLEIKWMPAHAI